MDSNYGATNTWGRLTGVTFGSQAINNWGYAGFTYEYGYNTAGRTTMQRMEVIGLAGGGNTQKMDFDATYAWDNEGRVTAETYPGIGSTQGLSLAYQYDVMGRLNGMTQGGTAEASATYGPANEMTSVSYYGYTETRTHNNLLRIFIVTDHGFHAKAITDFI